MPASISIELSDLVILIQTFYYYNLQPFPAGNLIIDGKLSVSKERGKVNAVKTMTMGKCA